MAGNGSRSGAGRSSGGVTAPPKPSAMKVNLFQQASRDARARATQGSLRAAGNVARKGTTADQASRDRKIQTPVFRRAIKGQVSNMRANDYYAGDRSLFNNMNGPGGAQAGRVGGRKNQARQRGYRAPRTRLY